jgi:hypothetical protein
MNPALPFIIALTEMEIFFPDPNDKWNNPG